ncbi:MAG: exosortase-associated protein EpsI, B-type, partial [Betaproteobacteria bacterium]
DESIVPVQAAPDTRAALARIYSQTLARTYINSKGDRVMLSVAYGGDQSDAMQVHKPEICYPAQGFSVVSILTTYLATQFGQLPVKRLVAVHGARVEPITYWITVGDRVARTGWEQKIAQLRYGLTGKIPDGLLFRVSSIDRDEARAYEIQSEFVRSVLSSLTASDRARLVGTFGA